MTSMPERFRRWYAYEKEVHAATIASLATVPPERRGDADFRKAVELVAHLGAARRLWLHRMGVAPSGPSTAAQLFPTDVALESLPDEQAEVDAAWTAYLSELDERELHRVVDYRSMEGPRFRNTVEDLLTQLFGHSWYHRGQVASLVRRLGGKPAETDYVFWSREAVE